MNTNINNLTLKISKHVDNNFGRINPLDLTALKNEIASFKYDQNEDFASFERFELSQLLQSVIEDAVYQRRQSSDMNDNWPSDKEVEDMEIEIALGRRPILGKLLLTLPALGKPLLMLAR